MILQGIVDNDILLYRLVIFLEFKTVAHYINIYLLLIEQGKRMFNQVIDKEIDE